MPPLYLPIRPVKDGEAKAVPPQLPQEQRGDQAPLLPTKEEIDKVIKIIKQEPPRKALEIGYLYATQDRGQGLVKVGYAEERSAKRPEKISKCGLEAGRIFQTTNFKWAFKAEKIVQYILSKWQSSQDCQKCKVKHQELFWCSFGHIISTIDLVKSWVCQAEPYEEIGNKGRLKDDWRAALTRFEHSQRANSNHHMEWIEFFRIDLQFQKSQKTELSSSETPNYLLSGPVNIFAEGTLRFWVKETTPRTPVKRPRGLKASDSARTVRQNGALRPKLTQRPESAPAKIPTILEQSPLPQETPSKMPKRTLGRPRRPPTTDSGLEFSEEKGNEDSESEYDSEDEEEGDEEDDEEEDEEEEDEEDED